MHNTRVRVRAHVGAGCLGSCLCSVGTRRTRSTFAPKRRQRSNGKSAGPSDHRDAQARSAKGLVHRCQGPGRRVLDPGQDQGRQSHNDDHRSERLACIGGFELERRRSAAYDRAGSSEHEPRLSACQLRPALGRSIGGSGKFCSLPTRSAL
jgi:hypothetical protein